MDFLLIIAAVLLPPLGVFLRVGLTTQFWINLALTIFGWIPGIVHALFVVLTPRFRIAGAG